MRTTLPRLVLLLHSLLGLLCYVCAETLVGFKTEPWFTPEIFEIHHITSNRSLLAPGYLFVDPFVKNYGIGPSIYTLDGELVWYGNETASYRVQDFKTCDYLGQRGKHLCWHEAKERKGHNPFGRKVIFDDTYKQVGHNYTKAGRDVYPNTHEFRMLPGGASFLETVYQPVKMDLQPYAGPKDGWVFDGCFMEVDVNTGDPFFKWCYLDYLPVWHTTVFIPGPEQTNISFTPIGAGTYDKPWDFFHINAVDKNPEGDYLISSRYLDQLFKIAGPNSTHGLVPGTVIWRLGGIGNDFRKNFTFSRQHSARFVSTDETGTLVSILANNWDGHTEPLTECSEGMLIHIDDKTDDMRASLVQSFPQPSQKLVAAQGSMQMLPNGNAFLGWGNRRDISEFSPEAELLYHAEPERYSYRSKKYEWVARPHWPPKLLAYTQSCSPSEVHAYVSWNGATDVKSWRFHAATSNLGPWIPAGTFPKNGFETHIKLLTAARASSKLLSLFTRYVSAEALDSQGNVLGSVVSATFMPCQEVAAHHHCNASECQHPLGYRYLDVDSCATECGGQWIPGAAAALLICAALEMLDMLYHQSQRMEPPRSSSELDDGEDNEEKGLLQAGLH